MSILYTHYWYSDFNTGVFGLMRLGIRAASNSAYSGYPELWIFKVSCSQIPRRAFAGIRTHDPLFESPTS
jgi:hypothetical protein